MLTLNRILKNESSGVFTFAIVVSLVYISGHAKVANLDSQVVGDHAVTSSQIAMDKLARVYVGHAITNLAGHLQDSREERWCSVGMLFVGSLVAKVGL